MRRRAGIESVGRRRSRRGSLAALKVAQPQISCKRRRLLGSLDELLTYPELNVRQDEIPGGRRSGLAGRDPERPFDQHIPDTLGHEDHSLGGDVYGEVTEAFVEGTRLEKILITGPSVRCHHQSVLDHPGLVASGHADGTLEAIEDSERPFWLAVQWHPETQDDAGLFTALVGVASSRS